MYIFFRECAKCFIVFFGERGFVRSGALRNATVKAKKDTRTLALSLEAFEKLKVAGTFDSGSVIKTLSTQHEYYSDKDAERKKAFLQSKKSQVHPKRHLF